MIKEINPYDYQALIIPGGFNDAGYTEVYNKKMFVLSERYMKTEVL